MSAADPSFWEQYGPLGMGIVVFGGVIAYLFKLLVGVYKSRLAKGEKEVEGLLKERDERVNERARWEIERSGWELERQRMRGELDKKHLELVETYGHGIRDLFRESQSREDTIRREGAELLETISVRAEKAAEANVAVMNKLYERFVGPRGGRRGG